MVAASHLKHTEQSAETQNKLTQLTKDLSACHLSSANALRLEISSVMNANRREHEFTRKEIRSHIDHAMQKTALDLVQQKTIDSQKERLIESLRFDDIDTRNNDISLATSQTFQWIFNDEKRLSWNSFENWLRVENGIYWINGKPGSGKSTLMKFIIHEERTKRCLDVWAGEKNCTCLYFFFWVSGSKLQRSRKGLLCSLVRQIAYDYGDVIFEVQLRHQPILSKRAIGDWSVDELETVLFSMLTHKANDAKFCVFVDGLDEMDQDEDIQDLLNLIHSLIKLEHVKVCVSSRPESYLQQHLLAYPKLRLQDLTLDDIRTHARKALEKMTNHRVLADLNEYSMDVLVNKLAWKADGVFLWVHYALISLRRGIRNEDDFGTLLTRLEELPSGMENLYHTMWKRLNGDEQRYREEASMYFSYHEFFPISISDLMLALDPDVQESSLRLVQPRNLEELARRCEELKIRILTRCAGLLEVELSFPRGYPGVLDEPSAEEKSEMSRPELSVTYRFRRYRFMTVRFIHRTARDFLLGTAAGAKMVGTALASSNVQQTAVVRGRIASLLQEITDLQSKPLKSIIKDCYFHSQSKIALTKELRQACEAIIYPGSEREPVDRRFVWSPDSGGGFEALALDCGCFDYIKHFCQERSASRYYLGYLFMNAVKDLKYAHLGKPSLAHWLAEQGADLTTPQKMLGQNSTERPFEALISECIRAQPLNPEWVLGFDDHYSSVVQLIERFVPAGLNSTKLYIETLDIHPHFELDAEAGVEKDHHMLKETTLSSVCIEASHETARCMAIEQLAKRGGRTNHTFPVSSPNNHSSLKIKWFCAIFAVRWIPPPEDAEYLNEAYKRVLLPHAFPEVDLETSQNEFYSRMREVSGRFERSVPPFESEESSYDRRIESFMPVLDPSEDIDESNWEEKLRLRKEAGKAAMIAAWESTDSFSKESDK